MSKIALQGNVSGTGTILLAAPNTSTDRTLTLPDEAGTIITSGSPTVLPKGGPVFRAYLNNGGTNWSLSSGVYTKIPFDALTFDSNSFFDYSTNYRFQPTVAGYYYIRVVAYHSWNTLIGVMTATAIYKNGNLYTRSFPYVPYTGGNGGVYGQIETADLVYLNGSTDYVEGYAYSAATNPVVIYSSSNTSISGHLVRAD